ncbi:hypothetical protein [Pseudoalteromonas denitrificans]|uniref:Uncharacterized protein n=1 Tax=Pseudoalteromonas denitrificans DSM 6059 TaxID=1123010 RepID=A0A1I1RFS3_9GAMM|nr:hypothetical protein [Pseudoalteromonas denitrificans]SFD29270.1 hypothetical protein SAMN02745724_04108 [Pseudoalteromonas denitrificans DSM 6059]
MDFSNLNKQTSKSFNQQKNLIKQLMKGKLMDCPKCKQAIKLYLPEDKVKPGARCAKGCTDIDLEFS